MYNVDLSDHYVDLSDNDVDLSDLYVDLLSLWHKLGKNTFLGFIFKQVNK